MDENKALASSSAIIVDDSQFSDDDIASWVAELGNEAEQIEARSANDDSLSADEDIPSILTELDDQLNVGPICGCPFGCGRSVGAFSCGP